MSCEFEQGLFYALIGRSSSGKSTLLHILGSLDKPTGNLDKKTGEETLQLLTSCAAKFGQILIVVTHDPEIAQKANRVIQIEDGKIL